MWKVVDKEMSLRHCERYSYSPDEDPFSGEEGSIWSMHYFFFNKEKKRVCYLYLRGFSVVSHSPVHAPLSSSRNGQRHASSLPHRDGAAKRASYWLGSNYDSHDIRSYDDDDDDDMTISEPGDDEVEVPYMNLDEIRSGLVDGGSFPAIDEDDEYEHEWHMPLHVRAISEEIGDAMELGD